jgi:hypothetical protein
LARDEKSKARDVEEISMSKFLDELTTLDKKIADRWKIRTHDNEKVVLSAADIDFILADVIKSARTTDITEKQGSAIVQLIQASIAADEKKSAPAYKRVVYYVNVWEKANRLNLQPFVTAEELKPIADLLRSETVSRIIFKSPGTKISYAPFDYIAVGQLIVNRDVKVFMSMTGGLSGFASTIGEYYHEENFFFIYTMDPRERRLGFVHEGTHIIQDWQDVSSFAHHNEADAFIAAAVAELTLYSDPDDEGDIAKSALMAAKMVIDKTTVDSNKDWQRAYQAVVTAVGKVYHKYGIRIDQVKKGEGASERTKYQTLLGEIALVNKVRDVVPRTMLKAGLRGALLRGRK